MKWLSLPVLAFCLLVSGCSKAPDLPVRPNLLIIITDDQRNDMLGLENPILHTPTMDRLATDGVRFVNAFVTTPICAASRATMLTGVVETTHRYTFATPPLAESWLLASYPALLRAAGYHSGFIGKFGVNTALPPDSVLFDTFEPLSPAPYMKPQADGTSRHLTDITADRTLAYLAERPTDRPFALTVSFNAPHADDGDPRQYIWPPAMDSLYADLSLPAPPLSDPAFYAGLPSFLADSSLNRERWFWRFDTEEKRQAMTKGYYRMISGVDAALSRILAALEDQELDENTVVILMGDNGYFLGERGYAGKWLPYEPSIRVPLIVRIPGLPRPSSVPDEPVLNIDLAPTLLDLAGLPIPPTMQGHSLLPLLLGDAPEDWRSAFLVEHRFAHPKIPEHEGVRDARYTYARYLREDPVYEELYDRQTDPLQMLNLASDAGHAAELARLRSLTDSLLSVYRTALKPTEN
jgi:arylsulfatase A-like enzyme